MVSIDVVLVKDLDGSSSLCMELKPSLHFASPYRTTDIKLGNETYLIEHFKVWPLQFAFPLILQQSPLEPTL